MSNKRPFLGLPPRVQLRLQDEAMGTYPALKRTGDQDYVKQTPSIFDDTLTLMFSASVPNNSQSPVGMSYPLMLPPDYIFGSSSVENKEGYSIGIANPNTTGSIFVSRGIVAGVSDKMFRLTTNNLSSQSLKPYDDSRVNLNATSSFYTLRGPQPAMGFGFSSPLKDKRQIVIELNPATDTDIYFSTGTSAHSSPYANSALGLAAGINSGIAYFNWKQKQWEIIGDLTTGSNVDFLNRSNTVRSSSYIAFPNGIADNALTGEVPKKTGRASGAPSNFAGFPLASKFDATGSQLLHMSDYINHPFMVERITFEWTGSVNTFSIDALDDGKFAQAGAFFILNQFETPVDRQVYTGKQIYFDLETDEYYDNFNGPYTVNREKEVITYGTFGKSSAPVHQLSRYQRKNLVLTGTNAGVTGTFKLPMIAVTPGIYPNALVGTFTRDRLYDSANYDMTYFGNPDGGRDMFANASGRSFQASVVGGITSGSAFKFPSTVYPNQQYIQPYGSLRSYSPYILMPTDKLVIGMANQQCPALNKATGDPATEAGFAQTFRNVMSKGPSKITMFGTIVCDNYPTIGQTNQPLTSDAIHEALGNYDTVDQYQNEPFYTYRGTYIDEVYDGKLSAGTRGVVGRCTEGTQGTTGSLLKGVKIIDSNEIYYDSLMPNLQNYFGRLAMSGTIFSQRQFKRINVNAYYFSGALEISQDGDTTTWKGYRSLPFPYVGNPTRVLSDDGFVVLSGSVGDTQIEILTEPKDVRRFIFQVGINNEQFLTKKLSGGTMATRTQVIDDEKFSGAHALRYGLINIDPLYNSAVYRYDRYGQFRDRLEQRQYTAFYNNSIDALVKVMEPAIDIKFVNNDNDLIDAMDTISQNLSPHSTSSLPYFDGIAVDRNDDPYLKTSIVITEIDEL